MSDGLDRYREERRKSMYANVTRTLKELDAQNQPINISRVAIAAGVSRQWLYASPFRREIESLRDRSIGANVRPRPAREAASDASLRTQVGALRERLREARAENQQLRKELETALGLLRNSHH
ncbi:MAG: transposase [Actinomycetia bacterium]|nr:transposase [Actinomycetes bacterium]